MVMVRELYALHTATPFCLPNNPGNAPAYGCTIVVGDPINNAPLRQME
jgi:hypothetical protein